VVDWNEECLRGFLRILVGQSRLPSISQCEDVIPFLLSFSSSRLYSGYSALLLKQFFMEILLSFLMSSVHCPDLDPFYATLNTPYSLRIAHGAQTP
jgi:hypothetical protein